MTAVLVHQRMDHHAIADQSLFDDPLRHWRCHHPASTTAARSLLTLGHLYEVLGRLHLQLLTDRVTDNYFLFPTNPAPTLFRRTTNHPFYPWQVRRQCLAAGMFLGVPFPRDHHFADLAVQRGTFTLGFYLRLADPGFFLQQLQLQVREFFAARPILLDSLQPQLFLQGRTLQL